jgi:hypothetical protein
MAPNLTDGVLATVARSGARWIDEPFAKLYARLNQALADARGKADQGDVLARMALDTWNTVNVNAWVFKTDAFVICNRDHPDDQITFISAETLPAPNDRRCGPPSEVPPLH